MVIFLFWVMFAALVAAWASSRGRSGLGYFMLSFILSPFVGVIILIIVGPKQKEIEARQLESREFKKCQACAELIRVEARKCKHCGEVVS
jgi:hypothetical protein